MKFRDLAFGCLILSAVEAYLIIHFAPQFRPTGGLGRLGGRLFAINVVLVGLWLVFVYPNLISPLRHIPGPKGGNILMGHARSARFSRPRGEDPRKWMEEIPNDGLLRFKDFFNQDALFPTTHETLKAVLSDNSYDYEKPPKIASILRTILGDGLILVEGNMHKFQRKHLIPSFQVKVIRDLYPLYWGKACEMVDMLREDVNKPEIEFGVWCTRVTLDIIGVAGFGRDFNSLKNPDDEFVHQYNEILEPDRKKAAFFALNLMFPYWIVGNIPFWEIPKNLKVISNNLYKFAYDMSKERRAELSSPKLSKEEKENRKDILSLLIKSNDFTDHELAHQVLTMMAAGHETTSSTLSWCVFLLAQYPEIQDKLRAEIRAALPSPNELASGRTIDAAQVEALPLLNAICHETLRLYPTVPITTRESIRPTRLGNYDLPTGTTLLIVPWAINRSTTFWGKDANEFVPGRWINADGTPNHIGGATSNYSNMTFLHGPRSCIGRGFAQSELKCLLAAFIGRYEVELTRDKSTYFPAGLVTTKPAHGMWCKIKEVEGW